jgi:hypothetical protein
MKFSLKQLLDDKYGSIIISIILGLGLSAIFRKACKNGKCIVLRGPRPKELKGDVYYWYDKCIKYEVVPSKCGDEKKAIKQRSED